MGERIDQLVQRLAGGTGRPGLDWTLLLLIGAGCLAAWALSYAIARRVPPRRVAALRGGGACLLARMRLEEVVSGVLTAAMLVLLTVAADAVLRIGEGMVLGTSGAIAFAATPLVVGMIEGVQVPRASALAERALREGPAIEGLGEPVPERLAA